MEGTDSEKFPLISRGNEGDEVDEGESGERVTSFGGRTDSHRSSSRRHKTGKATTSSYGNPSFEVEGKDKNKDIEAIIEKMVNGKTLTEAEKQRLKQLKEEENIKICTTTYEDGSISAGGYDGSIIINNKPEEKYYFFGVAKNKSINEFKRIYPNFNKDDLKKLEFGMKDDGTPVVKIKRISGKEYTIDYEERNITKGERKGQRIQFNDTIKKVLGKSNSEELDERERRINELNEANKELKKVNEELMKKAEKYIQKKRRK